MRRKKDQTGLSDEPFDPFLKTKVSLRLVSPNLVLRQRLIAAGWSRPQIAAGLVISANTVRTHTKAIYSKLVAHNRAEALAKARELGLLAG